MKTSGATFGPMNNELDDMLSRHIGRVVTFKERKQLYVVQRPERPFFIGIVKEQEIIIGGKSPEYKMTMKPFVWAGVKKPFSNLVRRIFAWSIDWETFEIFPLEKGIIWKIQNGL